MLNPDRRASVPGSHHVSEANFWPESTAGLQFPQPMRLIDSTIRKTYFTAGNATSQAGYVRIAEALAELGVTVTCLNVTWGGATHPTPQDWQLMTTILGAGLPLEINVWSDVLLGNGRDRGPVDPIVALRKFVEAGARTVAPGIVPAPTPDAERRQADSLSEYMAEATRLGVTTTITLAGVGLRDFDQMVRACRHAVGLGVTRLDLMDSTSSMSPQAMRQFVLKFRAALNSDVPVTMHVHDEFGLATAGALAAAGAGAHPDVSINGMSYRCGFAPLEEVAVSLEVLYGIDTGLQLDRLSHACRVVAEESQLPLPPLKPLSGTYAYLKHMPGDAAAAIRTGQNAFPPISHGLVPARIGAEVTWVWGGFSSDDLTVALAESCNVTLSDHELEVVRKRLDDAVAARTCYPRWLEPAEAAHLLRQTVAELRGETAPILVREIVATCIPEPAVAERVLTRLADSGTPAAQEIHDTAESAPIATAVRSVVAQLSTGSLIDLLGCFKRFDGTGESAAEELSRQEEAAVASSAQAARRDLVDVAIAYEQHFGFHPVVRAEGRSAADIARILRAAMSTPPAAELARVRADVSAILEERIARVAGTRRD